MVHKRVILSGLILLFSVTLIGQTIGWKWSRPAGGAPTLCNFETDLVSYWGLNNSNSDEHGTNTLTVSGVYNNSVNFEGSHCFQMNSNTTWVEARTADVSYNTSTDDMALSWWARVPVAWATGNHYQMTIQDDNAVWFAVGSDNNDNLVFNINGTTNSTAGLPPLDDNVWHHWVISFNHLYNEMDIYVDGKWFNQYAVSVSMSGSNPEIMFKDLSANTNIWYLDDIHLYDRTLSYAEVQELYRWGAGMGGYSNICTYGETGFMPAGVNSQMDIYHFDDAGINALNYGGNDNEFVEDGTTTDIVTGGINGQCMDVISAPSSGAFRIDGTQNSWFNGALHDGYSVSIWVKSDGDANTMRLVHGHMNGSNNNTARVLIDDQTNDRTELQVRDNSGTQRIISCNFTTVNVIDGNWHHIAYVIGANKMELWIDGTKRAENTTSQTYAFRTFNINGVYVGQHVGLYDEYVCFVEPITSTLIAALYNSGSGVGDASTGGWDTFTGIIDGGWTKGRIGSPQSNSSGACSDNANQHVLLFSDPTPATNDWVFIGFNRNSSTTGSEWNGDRKTYKTSLLSGGFPIYCKIGLDGQIDSDGVCN